jgi:phage shock protein A
LRELGRGLEMARAQEALNRAGANGRRALAAGSGALRDAEATLARIRENQTQRADVNSALDELDKVTRGAALDDRLAAAGFGPNVKTKPSDVLARIKSRAAQPAGGDKAF